MIKIIIIYSIIELSILIICLFLIFFMFIQTSVKGNLQFFLEKLTFILSLILIILIIISNNIKRIWQI
ncbi:hypothetical protein [Candidatus Karelsulcia muelleri]|uniref:hypothetical protein n=1 Tax=Candidatus Karelsulcia muelleri TaxID=336810 RepID=UPI0007F9C21A|nr:hypothetical protein [Candidatus Karelsulcia muelleri]ANO35774.1 hypothetical protein BA057_00785 [Candidatus Karelsulcia muelleri]QSF25162.1 hypothetical protein CU085_00795 [Candidatus Karelsulcia muelleri]WKD87262.1 hypothetical protein QUR94_01205 [Candidatus Karelsulcia muelleri]